VKSAAFRAQTKGTSQLDLCGLHIAITKSS
jgi:hypothetical protein